MNKPRIVVVGSSNTDMVVKGDRLPSPGETVVGGRFVIAAGGKGANQAVAAARLGAEVTFVTRVGRDMFGDQAIAGYRREGILTDYIIQDPDEPTGVALILVDQKGENLISVASGANHALRPADVEHAAEPIRSADILVLQLEIPADTVRAAAAIAHAAGVPVILDPAPAPDKPLDRELMSLLACIKPNETEAERLTGIRVVDEPSAREAAAQLRQSGAQAAVVTLGAKGAVYDSPAGAGFVPAPRVDALDSTAAGDAFSGALACAWGRKLDLPRAIEYASAVAALSVTRLGAQPSLPKEDEVAAFAR